MKSSFSMVVVLVSICLVAEIRAEDPPYLTTQSPITLFSTNDGEVKQLTQLTDEQTTERRWAPEGAALGKWKQV